MTKEVAGALSRRELLETGAASASMLAIPAVARSATPEEPTRTIAPAPEPLPVSFTVNGQKHMLSLDPRTSLLDAMREHLKLTGSKKGCDHGQCGACTMILNGRRINACLTLAVMHDGDEIMTIEGLGTPDRLHPMQEAFVKHDGYQCGYCTPGQIVSSVAMLDEIRHGIPSHVTADLNQVGFTDNEVRERMSGNICRCAAYPNIVAAIREVQEGTQA